MIYTEDQWKLIKQASPHYESAKHEYIRNAPRWLTEQVINVYEAATGKTILHKDLSCAVCVLNIYKQIGKTYFDDLKNHQNNNFTDLKEGEELKSEIQIETKDDDTGSESEKRNAKSKTGNKKKKE